MPKQELTPARARKQFEILKKSLRQARHEYFRYSPEKRGGEAILNSRLHNAISKVSKLVSLFENSNYSSWLDGEHCGVKRFYKLFQEIVEKEGRTFLYGSAPDYLSTNHSNIIKSES